MIYEPAPKANVLLRELVIKLHNEPIAGALALGGLCRCRVCRPDLHVTDEGGES